MDKCPFCKSNNFAPIAPGNGKTYGLVETNKDNSEVELERVLPVDLYGCMDCKSVVIKCESLEEN